MILEQKNDFENMDIADFIKMSFKERYELSLTIIRKHRVLWILQNSNGQFPLNESYDGGLELMIWSKENFANYNRVGEWSTEIPVPISIDKFIEEMVPKMRNKGVKILLSVMRDKRGKVLSLDDFLSIIH